MIHQNLIQNQFCCQDLTWHEARIIWYLNQPDGGGVERRFAEILNLAAKDDALAGDVAALGQPTAGRDRPRLATPAAHRFRIAVFHPFLRICVCLHPCSNRKEIKKGNYKEYISTNSTNNFRQEIDLSTTSIGFSLDPNWSAGPWSLCSICWVFVSVIFFSSRFSGFYYGVEEDSFMVLHSVLRDSSSSFAL